MSFKFLIFLLLIITICPELYAQSKVTNIDSMAMKGYFITAFEKSEVADIEVQRNRRIRKRSFKVRIDGSTGYYFFIPSDTSLNDEDLVSMIASLTAKNRTEIYLPCSDGNLSIFEAQFCQEKHNFKYQHCKWVYSNEYYSFKTGKDKLCYQIFYVSGLWLKGMAATEIQKLVFKKQSDYLMPSIKQFDVYLLYRTDRYELRSLENTSFGLWKEVPPIFQN